MQVAPFTQWNQPGVNEAMQQGIPVLVTEYNSISCGGTNVSDTVSPSPHLDIQLQNVRSLPQPCGL
jgi:hypothetical protein